MSTISFIWTKVKTYICWLGYKIIQLVFSNSCFSKYKTDLLLLLTQLEFSCHSVCYYNRSYIEGACITDYYVILCIFCRCENMSWSAFPTARLFFGWFLCLFGWFGLASKNILVVFFYPISHFFPGRLPAQLLICLLY